MAPKKNFILPQTARYTFTVEKDILKEVRKFAIDYEMDEREVPEFALRFLAHTYRNMALPDREKGLAFFLPVAPTEESEDI